MKINLGSPVVVVSAALILFFSHGLGAAETNTDAVLARSLISKGNPARLSRVFERARDGQALTVSVIGGSITQGARASKPENRYANRVADWWRKSFPKSDIKLVNAGIGATGSDYGAMRASRDLLVYHPDFVVVEFALNDLGAPQGGAESLEGLVRQIMNQPNLPAVMLLFMMNEKGQSMAEWHAKVGTHYDLPMVSFREALWPELQAGRLQWRDIEADDVHPNDRGHDYMALFVNHALEQILDGGGNSETKIPPLPKPLFSDQFEHVTFLAGGGLKPVTNSGWQYETNGWAFVATEPGSVVEFEVEGRSVLASIWREHKPLGKARLQVDDQPPIVKDTWYDQTWGGYRDTFFVGRNLEPGRHRLKIEVLKEKNPSSTGHEIRLVAIGCAGISK